MKDRGKIMGEMIFNREGFIQFWAVYPRKVARLAAIRAWNKAKPDADLVRKMLETIGWQRATRKWHEGFIPNPATWLNGGCWDDEPETKATASRRWQWADCPHTPHCPNGWTCQSKDKTV